MHSKIPNVSIMPIAPPANFTAFSFSFRPIERLKFAAPPMPHKSASAVQVMLKGKATFVAAFPSIPTLLPIKNWSTMLYSELTSIAIILGTANLASKLPIASVPNGLFCFSPICSFSFLLHFYGIFCFPFFCILQNFPRLLCHFFHTAYHPLLFLLRQYG